MAKFLNSTDEVSSDSNIDNIFTIEAAKTNSSKHPNEFLLENSPAHLAQFLATLNSTEVMQMLHSPCVSHFTNPNVGLTEFRFDYATWNSLKCETWATNRVLKFQEKHLKSQDYEKSRKSPESDKMNKIDVTKSKKQVLSDQLTADFNQRKHQLQQPVYRILSHVRNGKPLCDDEIDETELDPSNFCFQFFKNKSEMIEFDKQMNNFDDFFMRLEQLQHLGNIGLSRFYNYESFELPSINQIYVFKKYGRFCRARIVGFETLYENDASLQNTVDLDENDSLLDVKLSRDSSEFSETTSNSQQNSDTNVKSLIFCKIIDIDSKCEFERVSLDYIYLCPVIYQLIRPRTCLAEIRLDEKFKTAYHSHLLKLNFSKYLISTEFVNFKNVGPCEGEHNFLSVEDLKKVDLDDDQKKHSSFKAFLTATNFGTPSETDSNKIHETYISGVNFQEILELRGWINKNRKICFEYKIDAEDEPRKVVFNWLVSQYDSMHEDDSDEIEKLNSASDLSIWLDKLGEFGTWKDLTLAVVYASEIYDSKTNENKVINNSSEENKQVIDLCVVKSYRPNLIYPKNQLPLPCLESLRKNTAASSVFEKHYTASVSQAVAWEFGVGPNKEHMKRIKHSVYHKLM